MPGLETPGHDSPTPTPKGPTAPGVPSGGTNKGPLLWTHMESDPMSTGPAALQTARLGAWEALDPTTRARHLRAFVVMSLQAATIRNEPQQLGLLSAQSYPDDEHNAAGAAVARTLLLLAPRTPILISRGGLTVDGQPPIETSDPGAGLGWMAVVLIGCAAAAAGVALGWFGSTTTAEKADAANFRDHKTRQLASTQAAAIDVLAKHAERERLAGKPLPFSDEEKRLLGTLEDVQREIVAERKQPLPSPFDGAKHFGDVVQKATGFLEALLPLALIGGGFYLLSRFAGDASPPAPEVPAPDSAPRRDEPEAITLTRNKDGVYEV